MNITRASYQFAADDQNPVARAGRAVRRLPFRGGHPPAGYAPRRRGKQRRGFPRRANYNASAQESSGVLGLDAGVPVEWHAYGTPPARGPWLVLVPMMSLRAYPGESEAVLEQARTIGLDLLLLYGPAGLGKH